MAPSDDKRSPPGTAPTNGSAPAGAGAWSRLAEAAGLPTDATADEVARQLTDRLEAARKQAEELSRARGDAAALLEVNRRLREVSHRKDDLLALCAHDLRSPLNVLMGQTRLLLRGARGALEDAQRKSVEAVERQASRLLELADDLLGLRALELGRLDLKRQPTDLAAVCSEVADAWEASAQEKGVELSRSIPASPLSLPLDRSKIREVLSHVVANAVNQTPSRGRVEISLEALPDGARVVVEDTRPAAWPEQASLLLQRLHAAREVEHRTPTPPGGGGLGLAIARELVELHGGTVETESGVAGTRVAVVVPGEVAAVAAQAQRRPPAVPNRPRVLIVEDESDVREALSLLLEEDYDVRTARDGQEGVEVARGDPPDLVLMDLFMPRMDGFTALETLRQEPRTAEIPVIFISARGDDLTKVRSLDLGAVDFLQKPFSERELKARIERTLRLTRRQSQLREMAQTDALTGLANLRAFRARLEEEVKRARRYHTSLTCVMADMDNLKPVNDELGHAAGDRAIAAVAEVIRSELRETDFGARYGGDEFVVLLPHTGAADGRIFAERVCTRLRETALEVSGRRVPLLASFGVASLPEISGSDHHGDGAGEALVREADAALYAAKRGGRGLVVVSAGDLHAVGREPLSRLGDAPSVPGHAD